VEIHSPRFFAVSPQGHTVFAADPVFEATPGPATFVAAGWIAEIRGMNRGNHVVGGHAAREGGPGVPDKMEIKIAKATIEGQPLIPFIVHFKVVGGGRGD